MSHILASPLWSSESCGGDRRESANPTNSGLIAARHLAQQVKDLSAVQEMQETRVRSLGWEDPLEEGMATHSSGLAWRIPRDRGAWWAVTQRVAESDTTEQGFLWLR